MEWLKRLRTSRGFGVHSPFAYSLITDTLRMPDDYGYYACADLSDATARLVYRVAARLNVSEIRISGTSLPEVTFHGIGKREMFVISDLSDSSDSANGIVATVRKNLLDGAFILILNPSEPVNAVMKKALDTLGFGMSFDARRSIFADSVTPASYLLLCPLPHLPRQDFELYA